MTTTDDGKLDNMTVRRFAKLLKSSDTNTSTPITTGKVVKNDNSLYVAIDDDTLVPISDTSATVNVGDVVTIALTDETGLIVGNNTDKSVATTNLTKTTNGLKLDIEGKASKAELTLESDKLQSSITDTKKELNSTITQTAKDIRSEVKAGDDALGTQITQTADGLTVKINTVSNGRNLVRDTSSEWSDWIVPTYDKQYVFFFMGTQYYSSDIEKGDVFSSQVEVEFSGVTATSGKTASFRTISRSNSVFTNNSPWGRLINLSSFEDGAKKYTNTYTYTSARSETSSLLYFEVDFWASGKYRYRRVKVEKGNKATDWSKAPEDTEQAAANAQTSANNAQTSADDARKVATNYLSFNSTDGLVVGDMTTTLGNNTQITSSGVNIRNGSTVLASFEDDEIALGKNSKNSKISLCNNAGQIYVNSKGQLVITANIQDKSSLPEICISPEYYTADGIGYNESMSISPEAFYVSMQKGTSSSMNYGDFGVYSNSISLSLTQTDKGSVGLEIRKSDNNCYLMKNGAYYQLYGEKVLYNNTTGTTSTVTLSESAANFTYLEIYYNYQSTNKVSCPQFFTKVYSPNGKYVSLEGMFRANTSTMQYLQETIAISGTNINRSNTQGWYINATPSSKEVSTGTNSSLTFYIQRVVGIK